MTRTPIKAASTRPTMSRTDAALVPGAVGRLEPVPDAPHGHDPVRLGGIVLDLLAQPPDVDGHGRLVAERPSPDSLEQFGPPKCAARVRHQVREKIEFAYGQSQFAAVAHGDPSRRVDREVAVVQDLARRTRI